MKMTPVAISILTLPFCAALASAQNDPMVMVKQAAANQLGVLEYCQSQGAVDDKPVTTQRAVMARLPATQTAVPTDAAEALGKQGSVSVNGQTMTLASAAASHNTTVDAMCKQIGNSVIQGAAMLQQQGSMPAMPSAPGGMPAMPSGMPSMPSSMPGATPSR